MLAFRSVVIALTAALMNVIAAGASFGVVVAVFHGAGNERSVRQGGADRSFLPVMYRILFGLSMDYQVFLSAVSTRMLARAQRSLTIHEHVHSPAIILRLVVLNVAM